MGPCVAEFMALVRDSLDCRWLTTAPYLNDPLAISKKLPVVIAKHRTPVSALQPKTATLLTYSSTDAS